MEDAPKLLKTSQVGVSRHLDTSLTTQVAQIMVIVEPVNSRPHRAPRFLMHSCCAVSWQSCCQSVHSHIDPMHLHGSSHEAHCLRFAPKTLTHHRAISYTLPHLMTPRTVTPSSPFPEPVFQRAEQPCDEQKATAEWRFG